MACVARAENLKSGMAAVPPKRSEKVREHPYRVFVSFQNHKDPWKIHLPPFV